MMISVQEASTSRFCRTECMKGSGVPGSPSRLGLPHMPGEHMSSRPDGPVKLSTTNLYIKGLKETTTDHTLKELCKGHGNILSTKAVMDPQTNKCKGFGFVDFETAECAQAALEKLRQEGYNVGMAKKQEQADTNVFFKNLPESFTKENLEAMVKECGSVSSVHIMKQNGRSQGVGFARMACKADCERVIQRYNNTHLQGCKDPLLVKFADLPNKQKNQQPRLFSGQELQGAVALTAPPNFLFHGPPPPGALSLGAHAMYPETSMAAMTMTPAGMAPQMSAMSPLQAVMAMPPNVPVPHPHAQYAPSLSAAANYGYLGMAPAPPTPASYPPLQTQYGSAELQMSAAQATPGGAFYVSPTGMPGVLPGMQTMDPSVGGLTQWQ